MRIWVCCLNSLNLGHSLKLPDCKRGKFELGKEFEVGIRAFIFKRKLCFDSRIKPFFRWFITLSCLGVSSCSFAYRVFPTGSAAGLFTAGTELGLMLVGSKRSGRRWLSDCVLQCIPCQWRDLQSQSGACVLVSFSHEKWLSLNS